MDRCWGLGYSVLLLFQLTAKSYSPLALRVARVLCPCSHYIRQVSWKERGKQVAVTPLGHCKVIWHGWAIFWTRSNNRPKQNCVQIPEQPRSAKGTENPTENQQSWKGVEKPNKIWIYWHKNNPMGKNPRYFYQFSGMRCQALREATLSWSPTPCPRNIEGQGAVLSPGQETLTCS